jgi:hypothetical protein
MDCCSVVGWDFGVLDDKDLWVFLRRRIRELRLKHFVRAANVGQFLDSLLDFMRRCQDELVGPAEYARYVQRLERKEIPLPRVTSSKKQSALTDAEILERCQEIARVFQTVEDMLREKNLGTFGHMITKAYQLLKDDPTCSKKNGGARVFCWWMNFRTRTLPRSKFFLCWPGRRQMYLWSAIRTRRSTSFAAHRARRLRCSPESFPRPNWLCWEKSPLAFADPALRLWDCE